MINSYSEYVEQMRLAMVRAAEEQNNYALARGQGKPKIPCCDLCRRIGVELRSVGSPISYLACVDLDSCERERGKGLETD